MFHKSARARIVGAIEAGVLRKHAQAGETRSTFAESLTPESIRIDVQAALQLVADIYKVSKDPADYIFCVARAVTAEVDPNDPRPNENGDAFPREELLRFDHRLARRVYRTFDLKPNHINHRATNPKTARGFILDSSYNALDPKDQFIECLIAIDAKKDPVYAEGIRTGAIDAFSMGCVAEYTICSVCANRATSKFEFCADIRHHKMRKIRGKLAYERCGGVCYEELSAVDQPADPKALREEVLAIQAKLGPARVDDGLRGDIRRVLAALESSAPDGQQLALESELLVIKTKLARLEQQLQPSGQDQPVDRAATRTAQVTPPQPQPQPRPLNPEDDTLPYAGDPKEAIEQYQDERERDERDDMSGAEMGVRDIIAKAASLSTPLSRELGYINVEASRKGNVRVFDGRTGENLFAVRATAGIDRTNMQAFCGAVLRHIAHYGVDEACGRLNGLRYPRTAQVLDHAVDNQTDDRPGQDPVLKGGDDELADPLPKPRTDTAAEADSDLQESPAATPGSVIDDRASNMDGIGATAPGSLDSGSEQDSDRREEAGKPPKDALADETHDHDERIARVERYYEKRIADINARAERLASSRVARAIERFKRALVLAGRLQQVNHEEPVLKVAMADALLTPFDISDTEVFPGIPTGLTAQLVERGMHAGIPQFIASIIARASELAGQDDRVLDGIDQNLRHAVVKPVVAEQEAVAPPSTRLAERAVRGNPVLTTNMSPEEAPADQRRASLQQALGRPVFMRLYDEQRALGSLRR